MTAVAQNVLTRPVLAEARRVVVKIGSSLLIDADSGRLNLPWLESLADDIQRICKRGQQLLVVSSGAIALGSRYLGLSAEQRRLEDLQAAAASGQILLAHSYQNLLDQRGLKIAQILLTLEDTENRRRYLNARSTLETLLKLGVVPVINENDTVATQEIRYGDNDRLAARVAAMVSADCLLLLSDVDGLYDGDPAVNADAGLISEVHDITPAIESLAGEARTQFGSGGMVTKLAAAKICMASGCATAISSGRRMRPVTALESGGPCTWFIPKDTPRAARKQWIAGTLTPRGSLVIDAGAEQALRGGGSLLPVGVIEVEGDFGRGDAITVHGSDGRDIARGLTTYSSDDARLIQGRRSKNIEELLGYAGRDEIIHRDNLVLLDG
jgi:glutamate 5-kinase